MIADPLVGRTLDGRYRLDRLIGRGGMGAVYEAEHVGLDKRVAVKILSHLGDADAVARFEREAKAAAKVTHPNVVQIFDVGRDDDRTHFLVMELFEGRDLQTALGEEPIDASRAIGIAHQILDGLDAIHRAGLIHRDIKPGNVLAATRDGDDVVKLTDFGIAKSTRDPGEAITEAGKVVGTLQFMAPEQLMGGDVDHRADLYAVGLTLYAMLAGTLPFDTQTTNTIVATHLAGALTPLAEKRPDLPRPLVAAVTRALATSPSARFADASGFAAALEHESAGPTSQTVADRPSRPRPATDAARRRSRTRILAPIAIAFAVLVVAVPLVGALMTNHKPAAPLPAPPDARPPMSAIARAHQAEDAGDFELAIAQYQVAYADGSDASYLFRIAELEERLGRHSDAVTFFRRYLEASPNARDRDLVLARVAALGPAPAPVPSTGSASLGDNPFASRPAKKAAPAQHCVCDRTKPGRVQEFGALCRTLAKPRCRCVYGNGGVCPQPFVVANNVMTCQPDDSVRDSFHLEGTNGAACQGYDLMDNQLVTGTLECHRCIDEVRSFTGQPGDACTGFDPHTGEKLPGELVSCAP